MILATTGLYTGGGIASVSRCIAKALEEEVRAGRIEPFDTVSLSDRPDDPRRSAVGGTYRYARGSQIRFAWELWRSIRRRNPDVVLFDHAGLARTMHIQMPFVPPRAYGIFAHGGELTVISGGLRRRALEGARIVLTNSNFTADYVRRRFPLVADRVHPVLLCIDPDLLEAWEDASADQNSRVPAVLIVGRLWGSERGKGHDALLAALPSVRARVPDAELWVVGEGDDRPRLESLARDRNLEGAVRFFGAVPSEELGRLYRTASVFAMPSRQEGFGLVYAEAMWHGLPCIGSTQDAAGEVISQGETGFLVPYGEAEPLAEALVRLLSDHELAERMGRAAAVRARQCFTYPRFRDDLLAALDLSRTGGGSSL